MFILAEITNNAFFSLVSGIYGTVARVYDLILQVASNSDLQVSLQASDFANAIYVLAGVFMLFRVAIGMVQMLINPDEVIDQKAGMGKILGRIIVCITLLMLLYPSGILLKPYDKKSGEGGLLPRMEQAILGTNGDGLLENILKGKSKIGGNPYKLNSNKTKSCYYLQMTDDDINYYKIIFTTKNTENYKEVINSNGVYYKVVSGYLGGKNSGSKKQYSSINGNIIYGEDLVIKNGNLKCPKSFNKSGTSYSTSKFGNHPSSIVGGYTTLGGLKYATEKVLDEDKDILGALYVERNEAMNWAKKTKKNLKDLYKYDGVNFATIAANHFGNKYVDDKVDSPLLTKLVYRESSLSFARLIATSFQECATEASECRDAQNKMFGSISGNKEVVELVDDEKLDIDYLMSWLFGIAIIVYLVFLTVDIIIRKFKLVLLEFLAPIPIVSYISPNDKIFPTWVKMYLATYMDIFIKLFALNVALILLNGDLIPDNVNLFLKILYIIAILLFAKVIPSMISKLFGIDNISGSFKDAGKMFKSGVGLGAGAAIGGTVGAITGKGIGGKIGGFISGSFKGATSGMKGNLKESASAIASKNATINRQKEDGLGFFERLSIKGYNQTGTTPPGQRAEEHMNLANEVVSKQNELKTYGTSELKKKGANFNVASVNDNKAILSKDKSREVASSDENISMKEEYKKQENLSNMGMESWSNMSKQDKEAEFGYNVIYDESGKERSLSSAQIFQNDRVAALEDYGVAQRINQSIDDNDPEAIRKVSDLRGAITNARNAGVNISQAPAGAGYNNKTLKNIKDQGNAEYNRIEKQNADAVKINKYINKK